MEDVLDLYHQEYNPERPVVCFDETSRQLTGEVRPPIEAAPGRVARYDTEYQRNGTRNLFMICEPKGGWRHVEVTERRTAVDFAHQMRWLVDEAYPDAEVVRLVLDNLNTHKLGSLYEAFEPCEARRIAQRLEFHYTPTHGSWLNMAEIELSVFSRGCLNRRISDEPELRREVAALERERNAAKSAKSRFPGRLSVVCRVDVDDPAAPDILSSLHAAGAETVRLRNFHRSPGNDPLAIWRTAAELGMSVSVGGPAEHFAATEFSELVAALPNLNVIIEHLAGMGIHATGTPVMPHDDVFRQALTLSRFPNTVIKMHGIGEISDPPFPYGFWPAGVLREEF